MGGRPSSSIDPRTTTMPADSAEGELGIFSTAAKHALASPEIVRELSISALKSKDLEDHLYATRDYLIARAAAERLHWITAQMRAGNPREFAAKDQTTRGSPLSYLMTASLFLSVIAAAIALVCLAVGYAAAIFRSSLVSWRLPGYLTLALALLLIFVATFSQLFNRAGILRRLTQEYILAEKESRHEYEAVLTELSLGEVRSQINQTRNSYDCRLRVADAPGLAEVYSDEYRVESQASQRLAGLIDQMTAGGTIGLAGPRGAGKTSLIRARCPEEIHTSRQNTHVALFVSAPVEYAPREFVLHLLSTLCRAYLRFRDPAGQAGPSVPVISVPARLRRTSTAAFGSGDAQGTDLASQARQYLKEVRFLQTYTMTLGASASFPAGTGGISGQTATATAELPRTYPELVSEFCRFLRMVANEVHKAGGNVFIGIDELDKIVDGEQAQRFINELKVVLGVPNCYYLIAVSENALAAYEMRGLPVRDTFDSAFDEVIQLNYLRLTESRELLSKRVVGMSEPFICLCHCLSGGLPRDLIRAARHVVAEGKRSERNANHLATICHRLVTDELVRKLHATGISWTGRKLRELESELLYAIQQISIRRASASDLCRGIHRILNSPTIIGSKDNDKEDGATSISELVSYLYYLATLVEFFTDDLTPDQVEYGVSSNPIQAGTFDQLSLARQTLATDPRRAWFTINSFRREWQLRQIQYPGASNSVLLRS